MSTSSVRFDTTEFQFSHGKLPRGLGLWAFQLHSRAGFSEPFFVHGQFGAAKKEAADKARKAHCK